MSQSTAKGLAPRIICAALVLLGFLAPSLALAKIQAPVTTSFQVLTSPTLGGQCQVIWAGVPEVAPASSALIFTLTAPDGKTTSSTRPLVLTRGRATDASFSFATPAPGTYRVGASVVMEAKSGRFAKSESLTLVVPERGRAFLTAQPTLTARQYGVREPAKRAALTLAPSPAPAAAAGYTLHGVYHFTNRIFNQNGFTGTRLDPIRRATVQIIQTNHGLTTTTLGTVKTAEDGSFSYTLRTTGSGAVDLIVRLVALSDVVSVIDLTNSLYYDDTPVASWSGGTLDLGTNNLALAQSGAWNIYDAIIQGSDFARRFTGAAVPPVRCRWAVGNTDGTYYMNANHTISILGSESDPDEFDDSVILHEYGHFIASTYSMDKSPGGSHAWTSHISAQLAWSEGWATFFSSAVRNAPYYVDSSGFFGTMVIDLEQPTGDVTGDDNEGAVAATLWDIFDSASDGMDRLSDGFSNIWYIFTHYFTFKNLCVIRDFFDGWIASNRGHVTEVQDIFTEHGIAYPHIIVTRIAINNDAEKTASTTVTLNNTCIGVPVSYLASEKADFSGAVWKPWSSAPAFGLSSGPANKGVYFKVRNAAGEESAVVVDDIILGTLPITPLIIGAPAIDGGVVTEFDYDLYSFTITAAGQYTIDTVAGTLTDSLMDLYGPNNPKTLLEENDDGHGPWDYMSRITRTLQPGTYYVKIKGFASELGTYKVWLDQGAGDPLMPQLKIDGPALSGRIDNTGGTADNWFRFNVVEAGAYTIQTTPGALYDSVMTLYGPDSQGTLIETDDDGGRGTMSLISRTLVPGIYYVRVASASNFLSGDYKIQLYRGLRGVPAPVTINGPAVSGSISTSTLGMDFGWFAFTVTVPGAYAVETAAGTMKNSYLYVYGPDNQDMLLLETGGSSYGGMASLDLDLTPGKYYVKVEGYLPDRDAGTYNLRVRCRIQGSKLAASGAWSAGLISAQAPTNWFQFTVSATGDYLIETSARTLADSVLYLYGPGDPLKLVASNDDIDAKDHMSRLALSLKPGTYYVRIESFQDARHSPGVGTYLLRAARIPFHPGATLTVGAPPVAAAISLKNEADWYSFKITARDSYLIETRPGSLTAGYLRIFGPGSQIMLVGQDGGPDRLGRTVVTLDPGWYYVKMQGYLPTSLGSYTIQVRQNIIPLAINAPAVWGAIDPSGDSDWFSFRVSTEGTYTIDTGAGSLTDNYLRLYGPDNAAALLAQDDNSGSGNMAQITLKLKPGLYTVRVNARDPAGSGTYQIKITR